MRAIVVDDERLARDFLTRMLAMSEQIDQIQTCASIAEAGEQIFRFRPDVIFLDIQMPGGTGFDLLERLKSGSAPVVIFTTAFAEFGPKAFDVQACDYLLKPFDEERLGLALDRAGEALRHHSRSRSVRLTAQDIDWMAAEDNYVRIHSGTQNLLVRSTLEKLERDLKDGTLLRVHRSWIVNINRVKEIRRGESNNIRSSSKTAQP